MDIPSHIEGPIPKDFDPSNAPNLEDIEKQFAVKCIEQAQTYWKLLGALPPKALKLTKHDDEIFASLQESFPDLASNKDGCLVRIDENAMKSQSAKSDWRSWIAQWEKKVNDYNFGTLLRSHSAEDYTEANTIFTTRIQFYAVEIARNRLGLNDAAHELAKEEAKA